jgi:2,3,4,5-tetrahydropyridine-2-carboxylate N-succinyltransferase
VGQSRHDQPGTKGEVRQAVDAALAGSDAGSLRVAEKVDGAWAVNQWLKKGGACCRSG